MSSDDRSHVVDRTGWARGPWDSEPDRVEWRDEETGMPCLALRNDLMGNWCGYVGLAPGHPLHGKRYGELPVEVEVHGGLTYSDRCGGHICHTPAPGEPDDIWWLGFDCGHCLDVSPGMDAQVRELTGRRERVSFPGQAYRDLDYVRRECARLAAQLAEVRP